MFSVSSSGTIAAITVSTSPVGVDVEILNADIRIQQKALTSVESQLLDGLDADQKVLAFFRLWTAKEAVLKAGFGSLLDDPASVVAVDALHADRSIVHDKSRRWHVDHQTVDLDDGRRALVAVARMDDREIVNRWLWT
jgi:phosphopantetheinyl transferase